MALNSSGPISLGGSTSGQSIALELGLGTTTQISLNQTNVRTLAGVASGQIVMPTNFWGKSNGSAIAIFYQSMSNAYPGGLVFDSSGNYITALNIFGASYFNFLKSTPTGTGTDYQNYTCSSQYINNTFSTYYGTHIGIDASNNIYYPGYYASCSKAGLAKLNSSFQQQFTLYNTDAYGGVLYFMLTSPSGYLFAVGTGTNLVASIGGRVTVYSFGAASSLTTGAQVVTGTLIGYSNTSSTTYGNTMLGLSSMNSSGKFVVGTYFGSLAYNMFTVFTTSGSTVSQSAQYRITTPPSGSQLGYKYGMNGDVLYFNIYSTSVSSFVLGAWNTTTSALTFARSFTPVITGGGSVLTYYPITAADSSGNSYTSFFSYNNNSTYLQGYIVKYNSSGTIQWQRTIDFFIYSGQVGPTRIVITDIKVDSSGYYYVSGFAFMPINTAYSYDFILKLPTDGSLTGTYNITNSGPTINGGYFNYSYGNGTETSSSIGIASYTTVTAGTNSYNFNSATPSFTNTTPSLPTGYATLTSTSSGSVLYDIPGTYSWICPTGVTSVSVVCIGGGGGTQTPGGYNQGTGGGGGGGLGYKNNYSVTPGNSYTVQVGYGGNGQDGLASYFVNGSTVYGDYGRLGGGSNSSVIAAGGAYSGDGGGNGGKGGSSYSNNPGGGGGAGGYAGAGGNGAPTGPGAYTPTAGAGGGGGGGNIGYPPVGGGGVYVLGQGSNGVAGSGGGSGGMPGTNNPPLSGGFYGGGAGGQYYYPPSCCCGGYVVGGGLAGGGAVRIVWPGSSRTFPSTNVGLP